MSSQEWGWFIPLEIPYIEPIKNNNKIKKKIIKSSYITNQPMASIDEKNVYSETTHTSLEKKNSMNPLKIIQEPTYIEILDKKYDFGNVFAGILVNTILLCGACVYLKTNKF
tara:strand:+ start:421 stop:756 length:336 start_codon:yes stop_codon:yes gene_type:complete